MVDGTVLESDVEGRISAWYDLPAGIFKQGTGTTRYSKVRVIYRGSLVEEYDVTKAGLWSLLRTCDEAKAAMAVNISSASTK
ncbi:MAG: hypothetical protein Q7O66_01135 [Dehalococcoidia bacterium]|nr:hypothetical protein [Dehalococcoidia bacterium]